MPQQGHFSPLVLKTQWVLVISNSYLLDQGNYLLLFDNLFSSDILVHILQPLDLDIRELELVL